MDVNYTVVIHTILWKFANLRLTSPSGPMRYTILNNTHFGERVAHPTTHVIVGITDCGAQEPSTEWTGSSTLDTYFTFFSAMACTLSFTVLTNYITREHQTFVFC